MIDLLSVALGATTVAVVSAIAKKRHPRCQYVNHGFFTVGKCSLLQKPGCNSGCCQAHCRDYCKCDYVGD